MSKATPTPKTPLTAPERLPQAGGSYTRQPNGSLLRAPAAKPAPTLAQPTTDTTPSE